MNRWADLLTVSAAMRHDNMTRNMLNLGTYLLPVNTTIIAALATSLSAASLQLHACSKDAAGCLHMLHVELLRLAKVTTKAWLSASFG